MYAFAALLPHLGAVTDGGGEGGDDWAPPAEPLPAFEDPASLRCQVDDWLQRPPQACFTAASVVGVTRLSLKVNQPAGSTRGRAA